MAAAVDGRLTVTLKGIVGNAVLSGIQINDTLPTPIANISYSVGKEVELPTECPGNLMVYYAIDVKRLYWCSTKSEWKLVGDVVNIPMGTIVK